MSGVGGFVFGWLADALGRRTSIAVAIVTFVAGNLLCALAPQLRVLLRRRERSPDSESAAAWGAGQAMVGETFPPHLRGRYAAYRAERSPVRAGLRGDSRQLRRAGPGLAGVLRARRPAALLLLAHSRGAGVRCLAAAGRGRGLAPIAAHAVAPPVPPRCSGAASCSPRFNMSNYYFMITWLPRYLQVERGLSIARSGWATLAFVAGALLGYPAFGYAADRLRPPLGVHRLQRCSPLSALLMFTVLWGALGSPSLILVFLFVAGVGTGTWSLFGPMMSEVFPTRVRGSAMSIIMNSTRGVQFVAPWIIVAVTPIWGMSGGIALAAGFALLAAGWVWTLPETRGRRIEA